jgi:excisionase family DNA binding protein
VIQTGEASFTSETTMGQSTPWRTVREAASRALCGEKTIYAEVKAGRLRAARIGGRRDIRILDEWLDDWLVELMRTGGRACQSGLAMTEVWR